jgi:hypothetical protein
MFLFTLAAHAQCHLVASTETQFTKRGRLYSYGKFDSFEGLSLSAGLAPL